jgi:uncharacterized membrane protein (UPF0136 family)
MPEIDHAFLTTILRPIVVGTIAGIVFALAFSLQNRTISYWAKLAKNIPAGVGLALPVSLVGFIAGYLTGVSRSPAVGTVVPAVLTLIGGLNIYLFGVEVKNRIAVGFCITLFSIILFHGIQTGSYDREFGREARMVNLSDQERRIRLYRENRDLPADPPAWITTGEPR